MNMKRNIFNLICGLGILSSLCACKNGDIDFPDYEKVRRPISLISIPSEPSFWVTMSQI